MPALTIFKNFTTRPFAGDDLQIVCVIIGTWRFIQLICLIPLVINMVLRRLKGQDLNVNGYPEWCPQYNLEGGFVLDEETTFDRRNFAAIFIIISAFYTLVDYCWLAAVWSIASSVGTPTQPRGRDKHLRRLIIFRIFVGNIIPLFLVAYSILFVANFRKTNSGCGEGVTPMWNMEDRPFFKLFCASGVLYFIELAIFPTILWNKIWRYISRNRFTKKHHFSAEAKGERLTRCLGCLFRCLNCFCAKKKWGGDLQNRGEVKDFAVSLMEFLNGNESSVDLVMSDMYIGLKLLRRKQAEQQLEAVRELQRCRRESEGEYEDKMSQSPSSIRSIKSTLKKTKKQRSILTLQTNDGGYSLVEKKFFSSSNEEDVNTLVQLRHYVPYAQYAYFFNLVCSEYFGVNDDAKRFIREAPNFFTLDDRFSFGVADPSLSHAFLMYIHLDIGLAATPYGILLDNDKKSVVITIRGTKSLEEAVTDLQFNSESLERVGELCGFEGRGHESHRGVITRCKWIYNDVKRQKVLKRLYSVNSPYRDWNLVVVGHSLVSNLPILLFELASLTRNLNRAFCILFIMPTTQGAACAQLLSLMLRPSFPSLKCYAYEPPSIFDDRLASHCQDFITSMILGDDVIPRISSQNLDKLRDDFFDILAQIKVPKIKAISDVRAPCSDSHLKMRNDAIMCSKKEICRDTEFWQQVSSFRSERASKNAALTKLYVAGKIMHIVDTKGDESKYIAYWTSPNEFQNIKLSSNLVSDHMIPDVIKSLKSLDLDDTHDIMELFHQREFSEEEEAVDYRTFACFSMPNGRKRTVSVMLCSFVAWILSILSNDTCSFVKRSGLLVAEVDGISYNSLLELSFGIWTFKPKISAEDGSLQEATYCAPYALEYKPSPPVRSARVFSMFSAILGFIIIGILFFFTAMKFKRSARIATTAIIFATCFFQGLQLLFLQSVVCMGEGPILAASQRIDVGEKCHLSTGAYFSIASVAVWFIAGCFSTLICMS